MTGTVGKITGQMLDTNLLRDGVDLAFDTDLIYLDVDNNRVGIKNTTPIRTLQINGTTASDVLDVNTQFNIANLTFSSNYITNNSNGIFLSSNQPGGSIHAKDLIADGIRINDNVIDSIRSNENLDFTPAGSGVINLKNNTEVNGSLHATGNVTFDGTITFGDSNNDNVSFAVEVASNLDPDTSLTFGLGTPLQRWSEMYTNLVNGTALNITGGTFVSGIDIKLRQGNIWYVATSGHYDNVGDHPNGPFDTIEKALSVASSGDTVYIYPGTYYELFPLTIPTGVTVKGSGIRSVTIKPDTASASENVFLMNGETTVEDLSIADYYYDSINDTGYAFSFAPNFTVTSRSPYIRNVSVITKGSVTTVADPRGYTTGDAGRGAKVDGSLANSASKEASMLFHSVTFITPGQRGLFMTNGVRVEWLSGFCYFCSEGLYAERGNLGFSSDGKTRLKIYGISAQTVNVGDTVTIENVVAGGNTSAVIESITYSGAYTNVVIDGYVSGWEESSSPPDTSNQQVITFSGGQTASHLEWVDYSDFGAECRAIASANIYGNIGAKADGNGTLMYLINHNFGYIGSGKDVGNDLSLVNDSNETVELNNGKIYYQSMDQEGNFRVGDIFKVESATGRITFQSNLFTGNNLTISDGVNTTYIDAFEVDTGNLSFIGNTIQSNTGGITLHAANNDLEITSNFTGQNNLTVDTNLVLEQNTTFGVSSAYSTTFTARANTDFLPNTNNLFLGSLSNKWNNLHGAAFITDDIVIETNFITTTLSNSNLELNTNGTGRVFYDTISFTDNIISSFNNTDIIITPNGTGKIQLLKDTDLTGSLYVSGNALVGGNVQIGDQSIDTINPVGKIGSGMYPDQTASYDIGSTVKSWRNLYVDKFVNDEVEIDGTLIKTTVSNSDLQLDASGSGKIYFDNVGISDNIITTRTNTDLQITPNGIGKIQLQADTYLTQNFNIGSNFVYTENVILGTTSANTIQFNSQVNTDIVPAVANLYQLGTENLQWTNLFADKIIIDDLVIDTNVIQSTLSNQNLEFRANGAGGIQIDQLNFKNNSIVSNTTNTDIQINPNGTGVVRLLKDTDVTGNLDVTGNATVGGNVQIGDVSIDTINPVGKIGTDIVPATSSLYDIGLSTVTWRNIYGSKAITDGIVIDTNLITTTVSNQNLDLNANGTGRVLFESIVLTNNSIRSDSNQDIYINPNGTGLVQLKANSFVNNNFTISGDYFENGNTALGDSVSDTTSINGRIMTDILPSSSTTYNLGSTALAWNNFYSNKLSIDDIIIDTNVIQSTLSNQNLEFRANGTGSVRTDTLDFKNNLIISNTLNTDVEINPNGTGKIQFLKDTVITGNLNVQDNVTVGGNVQIGDVILDTIDPVGRINSNLLPDINSAYDIGSTTKFWRNLYFSNGLINSVEINDNYIRSTLSNADLELRANGSGVVRIIDNLDLNQNLTVQGQTYLNTVNVSGVLNVNGLTTVTNYLSGPEFKTDDILINDNYITTTLSNSNLELRGNANGGIILDGSIRITNSTIENILAAGTETDRSINFTPYSSKNVKILTNTSLKLPVGTNATRNLSSVGEIRFNNSNNVFEGFVTGGTKSLYGLYDIDRNTNITAELTPGANDNTIRMYVNGTLQSFITESSSTFNRIQVDEIRLDTNIISTTNTNSDLELDRSGSGWLQIKDDFTVIDNIITNIQNNATTNFVSTAGGYVSFYGTGGVVFPAGTTAERLGTPELGAMRFNSNLGYEEIYDGSTWIPVAGSLASIVTDADMTEIGNFYSLIFG